MRGAFVCMLALSGLAIAGCLQAPAPSTADIVIEAIAWSHGQPVGFADVVAVQDDRIVYVGDNASHLIGPDTKVVQGGMVLPGFRDAHMHPSFGGLPLVPSFSRSSPQEQLLGDLQNHALQVGVHGSRHAQYQLNGPESNYESCSGIDADSVQWWKQTYAAAETEMAAQGITTVVDAQVRDLSQFQALLELESEGASKVRWLLRFNAGCFDLLDGNGWDGATATDWARVYGVKLYGDGYLGAWVAALQAAYSDRPGWNGILVYPDAALDAFIAAADARGLHIGTHAIGDATISQVLDAYERAGMRPADRWTVEHVQATTPEIIDRFAELGAVASIQLSFATTDYRMAETRLGERLPDAYDWNGLRERGVVLAGGTDYPIEVITPLWGLQREVTRQELDGIPDGGFLPDNGLDLAGALDSITWGAAYAAHEDNERGAIKVGHKADLVVVDEDLFALSPDRIAGVAVLMTMVNGKVTFEGEQAYPYNG